ncbi:hypothetical protein SCHPADRAFT_992789 [Schizopora paradoxa]|uniref:F-box domain-containing protein n=1 Tax=Schizopora paradoxa TaxID=27342 RepID=A0A0H2SR58_9AGAM|nr:hypothetical protein SCHPADRAFT_992789 [Schizopora paradoxa]
MSTRPRRVAKTQALQNVQVPRASGSDVKMGDTDEEYEDANSETEKDDEDSDGSQYGSKGKGKKRNGGQALASGSEQSPKRARNSPSIHDIGEEESEKAEATDTTTVQKPLSRLHRLGTGYFSRGVWRSKKKTNSGTRGFGKLKRLLDVPLEVFCNILEYLGPLDLLNLTRTSWDLHEVIVSRQMKRVWQASLAEVDVPPLPDKVPINEVQLASMLFGNICQSCGASTAIKIYHDHLLVYLCKSCLNSNLTNNAIILSEFGRDVAKDKILLGLLPSSGRGKYLIPDFEDLIKEYLATRPGSEERQKWIQNKSAICSAVYDYAVRLHQWRYSKTCEKRLETRNASADRRQSIEEKLSELGYSREEISACYSRTVMPTCSRSYDSLVNQPRRLTDRIWKTISRDILEYANAARTMLRTRKKKSDLLGFFKSFCDGYKKEHEGVDAKFNFGDFLQLSSVKTILENNDIVTIPDTLIQELAIEVPAIMEDRAHSLEAECKALVNSRREELGLLAFGSVPAHEGGTDVSSTEIRNVPTTNCPLLAASTTFAAHIDWSRRDLRFQTMMGSYFDKLYPDSTEYGRQPCPWITPEYQQEYAKTSEEILEGLGLPFNVTAEHMDKISRSLICKTCKKRSMLWLSTEWSWMEWVRHYEAHKSRLEGKADIKFKVEEDKVEA